MWSAVDPLTEAVANANEHRRPGRIVGVEVDAASSWKLKQGEDDIVGDDFVGEVTAGKGAGKVKQVARIAAENPSKRIAVYAPAPRFNPIARADLESISNRAGAVTALARLDDLIAWIGSR